MLSEDEKAYALMEARRVIAERLGRGTHATELDESNLDQIAAPCFVTLTKQGGKLRGCIGTLVSHSSLLANIRRYAQLAAFEDPRFPPLAVSELEEIRIGISVLGPKRPLLDFADIVVGRHGLAVSYNGRRGVLLAKVPVEFSWRVNEFVRQTCVKAGLSPENAKDYRWSYFEEESFEEGGLY